MCLALKKIDIYFSTVMVGDAPDALPCLRHWSVWNKEGDVGQNGRKQKSQLRNTRAAREHVQSWPPLQSYVQNFDVKNPKIYNNLFMEK